MPGPLHGIRILEFSEIIAAPFAGMLLSDMGADIIKVEPPDGEPWRLFAPLRLLALHRQPYPSIPVAGISSNVVLPQRGQRRTPPPLSAAETSMIRPRQPQGGPASPA